MDNQDILRRIVQGVLVLVVIAIGVFGSKFIASLRTPPDQTPPEKVLPLVETIVTRAESVELTVDAQGTVVAYTESMLMAEVAGRVLEVAPELRAGARVTEGQLLIRVDDADYRLAWAESAAALAQAELRLEQTQADADSARRDWERTGNTDEPGALLMRRPQLADATAQLELARARREKAERDLERTTVRAPFDGRIVNSMVDRGQFVSRGAQLAKVIATDVLEVRIPLPDQDLEHLDLALGGELEPFTGSEVNLSMLFGGRERRWDARLVRTEAELDPASRMIVAVARVDKPVTDDGEIPLSVGMFVEAEIVGRRIESAHDLPRDALRTGDRVFVVDAEDRLRFRGVGVTRRTDSSAVIVSGIKDGDRIVVSPMEAPVNGMQVRAVEAVR